MSFNHANTVWQSPDGTWNRGFHPVDYYECGMSDDCDDETHEWCAVFDDDSFEWVSGGHRTVDEAYASWDGANPGSAEQRAPYAKQDEAGRRDIERLEDMAARLCERNPQWSYRGPRRQRTLAAVAAQRNEVESAQFGYRLGGYANDVTEELKALNDRVVERLTSATDDEKRAYLDLQRDRRDGLQKMLDEHLDRRRKQIVRDRRYTFSSYPSPESAGRLAAVSKAEDDVAKRIAAIDRTRARQRQEFFEQPTPKPATAPAKKTAVKKAPATTPAPANRGKTTAASTPGSFAPKALGEGDVVLIDDLWDAPN